MKKFLLAWFALNLVLNPVASALSSPAPYMAGSQTEEHCMGHEPAGAQPRDMRMDCCDSEYDQNECCDHCVTSVSALLNTNFPLAVDGIPDPASTFVQPALTATHSPPYKPPRV